METRRSNIAVLESSKDKVYPAIKKNKREIIKTGGKVERCYGNIIWRYLSEEHELTTGQLVQLGQATIPALIHGRQGTLIRIFAMTSCQTRGISIKDFNSLNEHPGIIICDGYYYKLGRPGQIFIEERIGADLSLLERELRNGSITDIGLEEEAGGVVKWLGTFGSFFMSGGWIAVFLLVILIIGTVSALMS